MTPASPGIDYVIAGYCYGILTAAMVNSLTCMLRAARARKDIRGRVRLGVAPSPAIGGLQLGRLKYRRLDMGNYSYGDLDDKPFQLPAIDTEQYVAPLVKLNPKLVALVRETAKRIARERGAITAQDVWEALDEDAHAQAKAAGAGRVMGAVWHPRTDWMQTGEWRRVGSHGRQMPVWRLREAVAA